MELLKNDKVAWSLQALKNGPPAFNMLEVAEAKGILQSLSLEELSEIVQDTYREETKVEDSDNRVSTALLHLYLDKGQKKAVSFILDYALDPDKEEAFRTLVLSQVRTLSLEQMSVKAVRRLVETLSVFAEQKGTHSLHFFRELFDTLEKFKQLAPRLETLRVLESIVVTNRAPLRSRAIALLGYFGEIDIIERLCMLPVEDGRDRRALDFAIQGILSRPINIVLLHPQNFEHLMGTLFQKMGYEQVQVTRYSRDGGVDIEAFDPEQKQQVFIQCKRYQPTRTINQKELLEFDKSIVSKPFENNNFRAVYISTLLNVSDDAKNYLKSRNPPWELQLIPGGELLRLLDQYLQSNKYQIETPLSERNQSINLNLFDE